MVEADEAGQKHRGRPSRRWLLAGLAVLVLAVLVLLRWPRPQPRRLVVGDSVTYMSAPAIDSTLGPGYNLTIIGQPTFRSTDLLPLARGFADDHDGIDGQVDADAVFLVGYNDVIRDDAVRADLGRMLAVAGRFRCAVWLTLPATPGGEPAGSPDFPAAEVRAWNERVREEAAEHRSIHVSEMWADAVDESRADLLLEPDGVHPALNGQVVLADAMRGALEESCPSSNRS